MKHLNKYILIVAVVACLGFTLQSCGARSGQYGCPERISLPAMVSNTVQP